jgi:hypothetical protein
VSGCQVLRLGLEGDSGVSLVDRDANAPDEPPVHPDVRLQVAARVYYSPHSAPPSTVFENFLFDPHTKGDLPAKHSNRSPQILDFARMGEQQGNRNYPSIRRSFEK